MSSFIEQCLSREAEFDDIDDFIDRWHQDPQGKPLYEFLGMTRQEYALWVDECSVLPVIVSVRAQNKNLDQILEAVGHRLPMSAKAPGPGKTRNLIDWL